jgi:hypothetical protein
VRGDYPALVLGACGIAKGVRFEKVSLSKEVIVNTRDRFTRVILVWIAAALTLLVLEKVLQIPAAFAQESGQSGVKVVKTQPVEVVIRGPVDVRVVEWNDVPGQAIKVKIDDPWPARIEIKDEVRVKGELRTIN